MNTKKIVQGLIEKNRSLSSLNDEMKDLAIKTSKLEAVYRIARAAKSLELRDDGMSISLIKDVVKGKTAQEKLDWDIAKAHYEACRDKIWSIREAISSYQSILSAMKSEYLSGNIQDEITGPTDPTNNQNA